MKTKLMLLVALFTLVSTSVSAHIDMKNDAREIPGACTKLLSDLLGEQLSVTSQPTQQPAQPQQTYQPKPAGKKVGDLVYHNGVQGIVIAFYDDAGEHGLLMSVEEAKGCNWHFAKSWCADLGLDWELPSKSQLLMIYRNKDKINAALDTKGFSALLRVNYWTSDEYNADCAWQINMGGASFYTPKNNRGTTYDGFYVRAVSDF